VVFFIPDDKVGDTFFNAGLGFIAKEFPGFIYVRPGFGYISRRAGFHFFDGFFAQILFDNLNQSGDRYGLMIAQVQDLIIKGLIQGAENAAGNVLNIGEVPLQFPIAV
jgi:hypothetical protein